MTDFYSELRPRLLESSGASQSRGSFDPLVKVTTLAPSLAQQLDTRGGELPPTSVERGGSDAVRAYATALHETVHWWQMIGTTTGLITGLTTATQATACAPYLAEAIEAVAKPVLGFLQAHPEQVSSEHSAWKAASRWRDLEVGYALTVDPLHAFYQLQKNPFLYESVGYALAQHVATTTSFIEQVVGEHSLPMPDKEEWTRFITKARESGARGFELGTLAKMKLGARHLFEGQARMVELCYRERAVERRSLIEFAEDGWLDGHYGAAFEYFLKSLGREMPEDPQDPLASLFLLACDYALNPESGYPSPTGPAEAWVQSTHPGLRFERLCSVAALHLPELEETLEKLSRRRYEDVCAVLAKATGWSAPHDVARVIGERVATHDLWGSLPASTDTAAHLVLAAHQSFCATKAELPHFFCWPAAYLTDESDSGDELEAFQRLLELYSPPFHTGLEGGGVDTAHLPELEPGHQQKAVSDYFRATAIYELMRQWLAQDGPFRFEYSWKPRVSEKEIESLVATFEQSVGVRMQDIRTLALIQHPRRVSASVIHLERPVRSC